MIGREDLKPLAERLVFRTPGEKLQLSYIARKAGVSTGKVLSLATRNDLGGVEFLGGVPGSIGGVGRQGRSRTVARSSSSTSDP